MSLEGKAMGLCSNKFLESIEYKRQTIQYFFETEDAIKLLKKI